MVWSCSNCGRSVLSKGAFGYIVYCYRCIKPGMDNLQSEHLGRSARCLTGHPDEEEWFVLDSDEYENVRESLHGVWVHDTGEPYARRRKP